MAAYGIAPPSDSMAELIFQSQKLHNYPQSPVSNSPLNRSDALARFYAHQSALSQNLPYNSFDVNSLTTPFVHSTPRHRPSSSIASTCFTPPANPTISQNYTHQYNQVSPPCHSHHHSHDLNINFPLAHIHANSNAPATPFHTSPQEFVQYATPCTPSTSLIHNHPTPPQSATSPTDSSSLPNSKMGSPFPAASETSPLPVSNDWSRPNEEMLQHHQLQQQQQQQQLLIQQQAQKYQQSSFLPQQPQPQQQQQQQHQHQRVPSESYQFLQTPAQQTIHLQNVLQTPFHSPEQTFPHENSSILQNTLCSSAPATSLGYMTPNTIANTPAHQFHTPFGFTAASGVLSNPMTAGLESPIPVVSANSVHDCSCTSAQEHFSISRITRAPFCRIESHAVPRSTTLDPVNLPFNPTLLSAVGPSQFGDIMQQSMLVQQLNGPTPTITDVTDLSHVDEVFQPPSPFSSDSECQDRVCIPTASTHIFSNMAAAATTLASTQATMSLISPTITDLSSGVASPNGDNFMNPNFVELTSPISSPLNNVYLQNTMNEKISEVLGNTRPAPSSHAVLSSLAMTTEATVAKVQPSTAAGTLLIEKREPEPLVDLSEIKPIQKGNNGSGGRKAPVSHEKTLSSISSGRATATAATPFTALVNTSTKNTKPTIRKQVPPKKEPKCEKKVGKRRGPLLPEQRKQASEIRSIGACLRCRFLKKTCNPGEPCNGCRPSHARLWQVPCVRINIQDLGYFQDGWTADFRNSDINIKWVSPKEEVVMFTHGYGCTIPISVRSYFAEEESTHTEFWDQSQERKGQQNRVDNSGSCTVGAQGIPHERLNSYLDEYIENNFREFVEDHFEGTPFTIDILMTAHRYYMKQKTESIGKALKLVVAYNLTTHILFTETTDSQSPGIVSEQFSRFYGRQLAPRQVTVEMRMAMASMWRHLQKETLIELSSLYTSVYSGARLKNWPTIFMLASLLLMVWEEMQFDYMLRDGETAEVIQFCHQMDSTPVGVVVGLFHAISQKLPPLSEWDTRKHGQVLNHDSAICDALTEVKANVNGNTSYLQRQRNARFDREDFMSLSNKFLSKLVIRN